MPRLYGEYLLRIIGGHFKGHRLVSFNAPHIRPTTDREKETIFNMIGPSVLGQQVLDLFSGTGSLGLEALSRGASYVTFVEDHSKSIGILRKNLEKLKITEGFKIIKQDVLSFLKSQEIRARFILIDPPFAKQMAHQTMEHLNQQTLPRDSEIYIESSQKERLDQKYGGIQAVQKKDYGDKKLTVFKCQEFRG